MEFTQNTLELAWWVVIKTQQPSCTYYRGPFDSFWEAQLYESDYVEDLLMEKPEVIYAETGGLLAELSDFFRTYAKVT